MAQWLKSFKVKGSYLAAFSSFWRETNETVCLVSGTWKKHWTEENKPQRCCIAHLHPIRSDRRQPSPTCLHSLLAKRLDSVSGPRFKSCRHWSNQFACLNYEFKFISLSNTKRAGWIIVQLFVFSPFYAALDSWATMRPIFNWYQP